MVVGNAAFLHFFIFYSREKNIYIWSPADFVRLPTDKEIISL